MPMKSSTVFLYSERRILLKASLGRASRAHADGNRVNAFRGITMEKVLARGSAQIIGCRSLCVLLSLQCLAVVTGADISKQQLQKWVDHSALIFEGKILSSGSNVDGIDSNDHPMIVQVKGIVLTSDAAVQNFGSLVDKELTVVDPFRAGPERKPGVLAIFFVNPLIYDKNIAVTATAVVDDQMVKDLSEQLTAAVETKTKKPLNDAVKGAYSVVIGVVQEIRSLPSTKIDKLRKLANGYDLYSEHGPQWREAVIRVQETITTHGDPNEKMVLVVFPSTDDRTWAESYRRPSRDMVAAQRRAGTDGA
jgi:hypothetical protein